MARHAVSPIEPKPNRHGLDYQVELDLVGLTEAEQDKINWHPLSPDFSIYLYIHFRYGIHRWLGETEDHCVVCGLGGNEVSNTSPWYAGYGVKEWTE